MMKRIEPKHMDATTDAMAEANLKMVRGARARLPLPWIVTEENFELYRLPASESLEAVLEEAIAAPSDWDRAVWRGPRLIAAIRIKEGLPPEVIRFDDDDA